MTKRNSNSFKRWALAGCAVAVLAAYTPAFAQDNQVYEFDIESKELGQALTELGITTGQQVLFRDGDINGATVSALEGSYTVEQAINLLLDDTGIDYRIDDNGTLLVGQRYAHAEDDAVTKTGPSTPTAIAEDVSPRALSSEETVEPVTVAGNVIAAGSEANLKGAQVEIVETGQTTATDDLGRFRFPSVVPGDYTLRITYLGRNPIVAMVTIGNQDFRQTFPMSSQWGGDEVVVYGSRSARAEALNQERTAENVSTVLSADLLGNFAGSTLSESLRRAPGVIFERDPVTGDGANIAVRGLAPDLNAVKLNGVELPEGSGIGRSATLSNVLTESISKVTISKTLLPNQDSSGSGGLIEIETKTPLDRPRRYASFSLEGSRKSDDFGKGFLAGGTLSGKFGARDQFGLSASLQYRKRELEQVSYGSNSIFFGQYLPLQVDGTTSVTSSLFIDPRTPFPFESGADEVYLGDLVIRRSETETENLALNISGAWEIGDHSQLFFDYQRLDQKDTSFDSGTALRANLGYGLRDVLALAGEERRALEWRSNQSVSFSPTAAYAPDETVQTDVYSIRGQTDVGDWQFRFLGGYTEGTTDRETYQLIDNSPRVPLSASDILPEAFHPVEGRVVSPISILLPGNDRFPEPLLSASGFDLVNDPANNQFGTVTHRRITGRNERLTGELSARYDFTSGYLKYLEAGLSYESAEFGQGQPFSFRYNDVGSLTLADFGLVPRQGGLSEIGVNTQINRLARTDLVPFFVGYVPSTAVECNPSSTCPPGTLLRLTDNSANSLISDQFTEEDELAAYVQGAIEFGKLEIVGGVRMTRVEVEAVNLVAPLVFDEFFIQDQTFVDNGMLVADRAEQTDYLPRVLANYRHSDNLVFRGGYYLSVARPQIELLSQTPTVFLALAPFFGPSFNQPTLVVSKGNPDLKPARTHSFDFSAEYYDNAVGVMKLGGFYKRIDNLLESSISSGEGVLSEVASILPDDPRFQDVIDNPAAYDIGLAVPENNEAVAEIWGFEASLEKQFTSLPGIWKGLGVFANYTYTDSSKEQPVSWVRSPILDGNGNVVGFETEDFIVSDVRFDGQATHSGTFGLTYNQYGFDANLAYTAQSRRQTSYADFNLHKFEEAYGTLDFRAEYYFEKGHGQYRVYVEGSDLTRGPKDAALQNTVGADDGVTSKYYTGARYYGGRQLRVGVSGTF